VVPARNIAIIALLALGVAFLPRGGDFAAATLTAITMGFLAAMTFAVIGAARANRLTLDSLTDRHRWVLYGALGVIVFLIAGASRMFSTGLGTLAWLLLGAASLFGIWRVWQESRSY